MATTVVLTNVVHQVNGTVTVNFNDSTELEFSSLAKLTEWAQMPDLNVQLTQQMCLAWIVARNSSLTNIALIKDKNFIFNLAAANPIRVQ